MKKTCFTVVFLAASLTVLSSPPCSWGTATTYLPLNHRAYDFLERMELHFFITDARLGTKPITRAQAAELLVKAANHKTLLSKVDREELDALLDEFGSDIPSRQGLVWDDRGPIEKLPDFLNSFVYRNRRNFYSASGDNYSLFFDPVIVSQAIISTLKTPAKDERIYVSGNGIVTRGTVGDHLGFYVDIRDSQEWGSRSYPVQKITTMPGRGFVTFKGNHAEFDETIASLTLSEGPFRVQFGRDKSIWGRGKEGTLGLFDYASPYNLVRFETEFWRLKYSFIAAELIQYPPMAEFYYQNPPKAGADSVAIKKLFSAHRVEIDFTSRLNMGFYETIVYGGRWELAYLNPVMFFRGAEHTYGDHDNVGMGADFRFFPHRSQSIYGELFIDDLKTTKLGTGWFGNKLAGHLGTFIVEPFNIPDVDARLEYTRIEPWVYTHRYPIDVYDHYGTGLGYNMDPNSDELSLEIRKRFSRRLAAEISFHRYRHGANPPGKNIGGDMHQGFRDGDSKTSHFLDGILEKRNDTGIDVSYELLWQLYLKAGYTYEDRNGTGNNIVRFSIGLNE
ncbi:MAG: capsule assembly Wzi family protein [Candidatus Latescibacter sp.]|nr:capsule assembly Wzi family protein [Candidatus Latescibacter sp.]